MVYDAQQKIFVCLISNSRLELQSPYLLITPWQRLLSLINGFRSLGLGKILPSMTGYFKIFMTRTKANLLLVFAAFIWGTTFVAQQKSLAEMGPLAFTGIRFILGTLIVLPLALREIKQSSTAFGTVHWWGCVGLGVLLFLGANSQQIGLKTTTVTNAAFITALYVPAVPLLGWLLLKHPSHWMVIPASLGCVLGTIFLSGDSINEWHTGDTWVLAGVLCWSAHVVYLGLIVNITHRPFTMAMVQFLTCGLISLGFSAFYEGAVLSGLSNVWFEIFYSGVLSVGFGYTLQLIAQRYTHSSDAAIILSSEALFATLAGMVFLQERLTLIQLTGCLIILICVIWVQLLPNSEPCYPK